MSGTLRMIGLSVLLATSALLPAAQAGERITVAAAADLKFALDEIVADFRSARPDDAVEVVYGSSGKFATQIRQGAPFDLYFSADIAYPRALEAEGLALGPTRPYAVGRIVLWSRTQDARALRLQDLADPALGRIAIANPRHAPYGKRAEEALRAAGVWDAVQPRLVQGENIAQTAQFVQTGNAAVGIIALSLALNPALAGQGGFDAPATAKTSGIVVDLITPETETSIWYFWGLARNFRPEDKALTASIREAQGKVFMEDLEMLESQQRNLLARPERKLLSLNTDLGGVQARRIIDRLVDQEKSVA
jgi:molybdate transport system substrate-binding protein